jgi:metallo-beta-lactamase class B
VFKVLGAATCQSADRLYANWMRTLEWLLALLLLQTAPGPQSSSGLDNTPVPPYRITDHVYYVGAGDIASYLITTSDGHILIDGGLEATAPLIQASVEALKFKMSDIKVLLNTQAHFDHAAGLARLKALTGARLMISQQDAPGIEDGGRNDFILKGPENFFPPVKVDRRLRDGDVVRLGNMTLTARLTAGHTKGSTTWTFDDTDRGTTRRIVVLGGLAILPGTRVTGMPEYPTIQSDYERTFEVLKRMPVDIFLGAHRGYYDGAKKAAQLRAAPDGPNPFIDPAGFRAAVAAAEKSFRDQLK